MPASPGDRKLFVVKIQVQELGKIYFEAPKGLRVVFYAKFTKESVNIFLKIKQEGQTH